jgi:hypothetical protein
MIPDLDTTGGRRDPRISVRLSGENGNGFAIIGRVSQAMRREDLCANVINVFQIQATAGNYNQLLQTCMPWVDVR